MNSAVAQAYYAKKEGLTSLTTETGAGQWGTALSETCSFFDIPLTVFMVKGSYEQKPFRKTILFGLTGTGYFDMTAYSSFIEKTMGDYIPTDEDLKRGFDGLPDIPQNKNI